MQRDIDLKKELNKPIRVTPFDPVREKFEKFKQCMEKAGESYDIRGRTIGNYYERAEYKMPTDGARRAAREADQIIDGLVFAHSLSLEQLFELRSIYLASEEYTHCLLRDQKPIYDLAFRINEAILDRIDRIPDALAVLTKARDEASK